MTETAEDPRRIAWVPLDEIQEDPTNPKAHADELIDASIGRHGVIDLMTRDDRTGYLISGHGRLHTIRNRRQAGATPPPGVRQRQDGTWLVPVVVGWASADDLDAQAALIGLNQTTILGGWLDDALLTTLDQLRDADALAGVGFDDAAIEALRRSLIDTNVDGLTDPDDAPPVLSAAPISTDGDLWLLGQHRLAVGSSADHATWERLAVTEATCIWTDPPYGVDYVGKTADALTIQNDADGPDALRELLTKVMDLAGAATAAGSPWYVAAPAGPLHLVFAEVLIDRGWRQTLTWIKDVFVLGHSDYHYQHEPIFYGYTLGGEGRRGRGGKGGWYGDHTATTVLTHPRPKRSSEHPTMKPVSLISECLRNSSQPGDTVLDPFAGSGSTLIAAHDLGRVAALIELDPRYADVICRRYQEHTGVVPVRGGVPVDFTTAGEAASSTLAG